MITKSRILIVTETFPPEVNGVARTVDGYRQGLQSLGYDVHVLRPRQAADEDATPDARTHLCGGFRLPRYPALRFGVLRSGRMEAMLELIRPDILYVATEGPLGYAALKAARRVGLPTLTGFHTNFHEFLRHYGLGVASGAAYSYLRKFHNTGSETLVGTRALCASLRDSGFRNVTLSPRGVDTALFSPQKRDRMLRASWGADDDTPVLIHVGRMAAEKNLKLATDGFAIYRSVRPEARMVFIGDGPMRGALERAMPEAVFCGMQTGEALAAHYASGDVLLFPSLTETFGNITLEGLASGLALVAFDYAAAREYVHDGWSGSLAPYGDSEAYLDCVRRLALAPGTAERLRTGALQAVGPLQPARVHEALSRIIDAHVEESIDAVA